MNRKATATIIKKPKLVRWADLPEEWLNDKVSRKMVVGQNEMLARLVLKKGAIVPAHKHVSEQISSVVAGTLIFKMGGTETTARGGDVVVIPPNVVHTVEAVEDSEAVDTFSPLRMDWLSGDDSYLRTSQASLDKGKEKGR